MRLGDGALRIHECSKADRTTWYTSLESRATAVKCMPTLIAEVQPSSSSTPQSPSRLRSTQTRLLAR